MLMRFDPLREVDRLAQLLTQPMAAARTLTMPMDAYREGDRFVVVFDVPGVDPDAIELTVNRDSLTVRAERRWQPAEGQEVIVAERPQGVFTRQLILGANLNSEAVEATYERGVLTLTIPVAEQARPRRVQVSRGDDRRTLEAEVGQASSTDPGTDMSTRAQAGSQSGMPASSSTGQSNAPAGASASGSGDTSGR